MFNVLILLFNLQSYYLFKIKFPFRKFVFLNKETARQSIEW